MAAQVTPPPLEQQTNHDDELILVYVWQWPIRIVHWLLVLSILTLSVTGYYMHSPFLVSTGPSAWVMGTMRFVHELAGFVLLSALLLRFYWFFAGNQWARWRAFVPHTKLQFSGARSMFSYYLFQRREPNPGIGHNPLAAFAYLVIFGLIALEALTGLVLFSGVVGSGTLKFFVGWIPRLIDIQYIRTIHYLIMYALAAFVIQHVYSAIAVNLEEEDGLMGSIFTGWKFVSRRLFASEPDDSKPRVWRRRP
jgi:Ni/Fe-hydrogenase 1 B-type cytochrome subunit